MSPSFRACWQVPVVATLMFVAPSCKDEKPPVNEKVSESSAASIVLGKTTQAEVEQLLGPGKAYSDPSAPAGARSFRWGPGKDRGQIEATFGADGRVITKSYIQY